MLVAKRVRRIDPATIIIRPGVYVRSLIPPWTDAEPITPDHYFITTGDAVKKTEYLQKEIKALRDRSLVLPNNHKFRLEAEMAVLEVAQLHQILCDARGTSVHLEAEWEDGTVRCRKTNPKDYSPPPDDPISPIPLPLFSEIESEDEPEEDYERQESDARVVAIQTAAQVAITEWVVPPKDKPKPEDDGPANHKLSFEIAEQIRHEAEFEGLGSKALGRRYNVSSHTIRMIRSRKMYPSPKPMSKLTGEDVRKIRRLFKTMSSLAISRMFNVGPVTIRQIKRGLAWRHIPEEPEVA